MANQDIVLNIVAKADTSGVEGEFGQMAQQLARIFDQALEGIGNKLAEVITRGTTRGIQQVGYAQSGQLIVPNDLAFERQQQLQVQQGPIGQAPQAPAITQIRNGFLDPFSDQSQYMARSQDFSGMTAQARAIQAMARSGLSPEISDDERKAFGSASENGRELLRSLQGELRDLNQQLAEEAKELKTLQESISEAPEEFKKGMKEYASQIGEDLNSGVQKRGRIMGRINEVSGGINDMNAVAQPDTIAGMDASKFWKGIGIIGSAMEIAGQVPSALRRSAVAGAEMDNMEGRMMLRGEVEKAIALDRMGGKEGAMGQGQLEEGLKVGGSGIAALALAALAPATGGLSLLGAIPLAGKAVMGAAGFNESVMQNVQGQIGKEVGVNSEYYQMASAGRETAVGGFRGAQAAGSPELAAFLAGGLDNNVISRMLETERAKSNTTHFVQGKSWVTEDLSDPDKIRRLEREQELSKQFSVTDRYGSPTSLRQYAVKEAGLSEEQFRSTMGGLAGMGGVFLGQSPTLNRLSPEVAKLLESQGQGLAGAGQIATGLYGAGGSGSALEQQRQAMDMTREMFEDAVSAGFDKAATGRALMNVASRSEQMGIGGAGVARMDFERGLSLAQGAYGSQFSGPQGDFAQGISQRMGDITKSDSGLGAVAGLGGVRNWAKGRGISLSAVEENMLQQLAGDPEGMKEFLASKGVNVSDTEAKTESRNLEGAKQSELLRTDIKSFGRAGGIRSFQEQMGVKTMKQAMDLNKMIPMIESGVMSPDTGESELLDLDENMNPVFGKKRALRDVGGRNALQASAEGSFGRDLATSLATVDAEKISGGLSTLGDNLGRINSAIEKLVERANQILTGGASSASSASQDASVLNRLFGQNSSTMSFKNGTPHDQSRN